MNKKPHLFKVIHKKFGNMKQKLLHLWNVMKKTYINTKTTTLSKIGFCLVFMSLVSLCPLGLSAQSTVDGNNCKTGSKEWLDADAIIDPLESPSVSGSSDLLRFWGNSAANSFTFGIERAKKGNVYLSFFLNTDCNPLTGSLLRGGADYGIFTNIQSDVFQSKVIYKWNSVTSAWDSAGSFVNAAVGNAACDSLEGRFIELSFGMSDIFDVCGTTVSNCGQISVTQIATHAGGSITSTVKDLFLTGQSFGANKPPVASMGNMDTVACSGETISLSGITSLDGNETVGTNDSIVSYEWDTDYDGVTFAPDLTGVSQSVALPTSGTQSIALRVTDGYDCTNITVLDMDIYSAPLADAYLNYTTAPAPSCRTVYYNGLASQDNYGASNLVYSWDFGDGGTSTADSGNYTYLTCDLFNVSYIAFDPDNHPKCAADTMTWTIALPVEMLSFEAEVKNKKAVVLSWSTASEQNNQGWDILRSEDGVTWLKVGFTKGANNSTQVQSYKWVDPVPTFGAISYYKLKQMDYNGVTSFSTIEKVDMSSVNAQVNFYPNPAANKLTVQSSSLEEVVSGSIHILNQVGQKVYSQEVINGNIQEVSLQSLTSGVYILETIINGSVSRSQFIKN